MGMAPTHDLIVIGGGPAGSAAGLTAARAGLRVALVDKAQFPRDKLCGGGITGRGRRHLREVFALDVERPEFLRCDRIRLTAGGQTLADVAEAPPLWMTQRRDLDALLLGAAATAGCTLFTGQRIANDRTAGG